MPCYARGVRGDFMVLYRLRLRLMANQASSSASKSGRMPPIQDPWGESLLRPLTRKQAVAGGYAAVKVGRTAVEFPHPHSYDGGPYSCGKADRVKYVGAAEARTVLFAPLSTQCVENLLAVSSGKSTQRHTRSRVWRVPRSSSAATNSSCSGSVVSILAGQSRKNPQEMPICNVYQ